MALLGHTSENVNRGIILPPFLSSRRVGSRHKSSLSARNTTVPPQGSRPHSRSRPRLICSIYATCSDFMLARETNNLQCTTDLGFLLCSRSQDSLTDPSLRLLPQSGARCSLQNSIANLCPGEREHGQCGTRHVWCQRHACWEVPAPQRFTGFPVRRGEGKGEAETAAEGLVDVV